MQADHKERMSPGEKHTHTEKDRPGHHPFSTFPEDPEKKKTPVYYAAAEK
jgi:hypothetical protein